MSSILGIILVAIGTIIPKSFKDNWNLLNGN
jgi:hypothetical protein